MRGPYYVLIVYKDGHYSWEFGSFDRSDVIYERDDYREQGYALNELMVTRFEVCPTQKQCDDFMLKMNNA